MESKEVYEIIAHHFDDTRYRMWPCVRRFMDTIPDGNTVVDLGCGNGKNMAEHRNLKFIAIDNCNEFINIVNRKYNNIIKNNNIVTKIGDIRNIPLEDNSIKYMICVAVFHHLYNDNDRYKSLDEMQRVMMDKGELLITLWAMEQPDSKKTRFTSRDSIVPWHNRTDGKIYHRYYRIWYENDFDYYIKKTNFSIKNKYNENGNWIYHLIYNV